MTSMSEMERTKPYRYELCREADEPAGDRRTGIPRSRELFRLFRRESVDPAPFYEYLAADTVAALARFVDLDGCRGVDIGGGPGYTADALRSAGARCHVVEYSHDELILHGRRPDGAVQGDGCRLPIASGSVDLVHSSNVLEHVPDPEAFLSETLRVIAPGTGLAYLSFTNWYSPWGGHETSPWHYAGGHRALRRYEARHGHPAKNRFAESLFAVHVGQVLAWFRNRGNAEVLWAGPRYLPGWARHLVRVPVLREVATWNLALIVRRTD